MIITLSFRHGRFSSWNLAGCLAYLTWFCLKLLRSWWRLRDTRQNALYLKRTGKTFWRLFLSTDVAFWQQMEKAWTNEATNIHGIMQVTGSWTKANEGFNQWETWLVGLPTCSDAGSSIDAKEVRVHSAGCNLRHMRRAWARGPARRREEYSPISSLANCKRNFLMVLNVGEERKFLYNMNALVMLTLSRK